MNIASRSLSALCAAFIFSASLTHAELPPTLKPHAEKFDADRAALAAAGEAQLKPVRERYLAALAVAQKAATAAAKTGDIAAIASEIEGVGAGQVPEAFPADLPRSLAQDRRNYVAAITSVAKALPPRQRDLATRYLQTLAAFDAAAAKSKDAALTEAVATEKERVVALMEAAGGGQKFRNVVANGDFSQDLPGGLPPGWQTEPGFPVTDATIVSEGAERFLRFRRLQAIRRANLLTEKAVSIPARAKSVEFTVRMRVKGLVSGKEYHPHPAVHVTARDARDEEVAGAWTEAKQDSNWKRMSARFALPPTAKALRIALGPYGAAGVIDFDDVAVEFK